MSTYYEFYIGVNKGDKVEVIGPFIKKDGEWKGELEIIAISNIYDINIYAMKFI